MNENVKFVKVETPSALGLFAAERIIAQESLSGIWLSVLISSRMSPVQVHLLERVKAASVNSYLPSEQAKRSEGHQE